MKALCTIKNKILANVAYQLRHLGKMRHLGKNIFTLIMFGLSLGFTVAANAATTTLTSSVTTVAAGTNMTFTATVAGVSPTGNVVFKAGTTTIGTVATTGTTATRTATLTTSFSTVGTRSITAEYAGDANDTASVSAVRTVTVTIRTSTTTVTAAPTTAAVGANVVLTANIAGVFPSGTVTFRNGTTTIGTGTVTGTATAGTATLTISFSTVAARSITAVYAGDTNNTTSTSAAVTVTTIRVTPTNTLTTSLATAVAGQNVVLTATLVGFNPTGTVSFRNGTTTIAGTPSVSISGNTLTATLTTSFTAVGANSITAVYAGDVNNNTVTSAARVVTVNAVAATTTTLLANPTATIGQNVFLTANVVGLAPTGTVTFKDGTVTIGSISLSGTGNTRSATLSTFFSVAGVHNLTAVYLGDSSNLTSTSSIVSVTVSKASPVIDFTFTTPNPSTVGANVTMVIGIGGFNATGTVTIKSGGVTLGTLTYPNSDTFTTSFTTVGLRSITAEYGGDINNNPSNSIAKDLRIFEGASTTTLSIAPTSATVGQNVTLTAAVTGSNAIGQVTFKDGTTILGATTLSSSIATFNTSFSTAGVHVITAEYGGDVNYVRSTSNSINLTVTAPNVAPTVSITAPANNASFTEPASVTITANAADSDGTITQVEFYNGATLVNTDTTAPYSYNLTGLSIGTYTLTARATDNSNVTTTSAAVNINVTNTSTTTALTVNPNPANVNQNVTLSATVTGNNPTGTITWKDGTTLGGTSTLSNGTASTTATFSTAGAKSMTAEYSGDANNAASISSAVILNITEANQAPTVSITAPSNGATYAAPASITLTANAADTDGTISQVAFYNGTTLLGTATSSPYSVSWNNVAAGTYTITAIATDNGNATTTSTAVSITVSGGAAQIYYIHTDQLNTPRVITNASNVKVWEWNSDDPFGNNPPNDDPNNTGNHFTFNHRHAGQYYDAETFNFYNYFRDYDPQTGRYIESDPIGLEGGINTYAYVESNPLSFTDRFGEASDKYKKPQNPNKKPPPAHRVPSGQRERNIGHPESEEHGIKPKGNRSPRGGRGAGCFVPIIMFIPPKIIEDKIHEFDDPDLTNLFPPA